MTAILVGLLIAALALVVPAVGPSRGGAHDFMSVHLIVPHHHPGHDDGAASTAGDHADDVLTWRSSPAISAAGPLADATSFASKGVVLAGLVVVLAHGTLRPAANLRVAVTRSRWDEVPTPPPR